MHPEDEKKPYHIYTMENQFVTAKTDNIEALRSVVEKNEQAEVMGIKTRYELRDNPKIQPK